MPVEDWHEDKEPGDGIALNVIAIGLLALPAFLIFGAVVSGLLAWESWRFWVGWLFLYLIFLALCAVNEEVNQRLRRMQRGLKETYDLVEEMHERLKALKAIEQQVEEMHERLKAIEQWTGG